MSNDYLQDLPAGTILVWLGDGNGRRAELAEDMRSTWGHAVWLRKDGERDRRYLGWSGSFPTSRWKIGLRIKRAPPPDEVVDYVTGLTAHQAAGIKPVTR